jgi:peptidoglycan/LPS O-acetylase OafA/YrhL
MENGSTIVSAGLTPRASALREKNEEIEALRGLAVIAVIVSHIGYVMCWAPGVAIAISRYGLANGVDLFFVRSGYVIAHAFYRALNPERGAGSTVFRYFVAE